MSTPDPLIFPCEFPVKVMGRADTQLRELARAIVERHVGPLTEAQFAERLSRDANFIALTFTIHAISREQLDALYRELTGCEAVLMAL